MKPRLARYDLDRLDQRDPALVGKLVSFVDRVVRPYHRATVRGLEHVPDGAALLVGNHNAATYSPDTFLLGAALHQSRGIDAVPYGLAHEVILGAPGFNQLLVPLGAVRAGHENARRLFAEGRKVLVYPGGELDAMRPFRHRNKLVFGGRRGYIRLALSAGVPIVPVVAAGAHSTFVVVDDLRWLAKWLRADRVLRTKVWPLTLSFPLGLTLGPLMPHLPFPSRIRIEVLEPIQFERTGAEAAADDDWVARCSDRVESVMQASLTRLAAL